MKYNNSEIVHKKINDIEYLQFKALLEYDNDINHFFSLRHGGISNNNFSSLNLGLFTGDDINNVKQNYTKILADFDMKYNNVFVAKQIHSDKFIFINEEDMGVLKNDTYNECDGFITNILNKILVTNSADCMLVIIYDKRKKYIANIHSRLEGCSK